jgi:hypothetical protein
MEATSLIQDARSGKALGHVALHYKTPADGPHAARLLELMGFRRLQGIPLPDGSIFYQFLVNEDRISDGVGTLYLALRPQPLEALISAIRDALKVGTPEEHPAAQRLRVEQERNPEVDFHIGIMVDALDDLESTILRLKEAAANDPHIQGRLTFTVNRAKPGDAEIDARMDASPVFGDATRFCYGRNGCQVFVETNLLASGPLGENMVVEFDHAFEGRPVNMFNKTELG